MKSIKETVVAALLLVVIYAIVNYVMGCLPPKLAGDVAKEACIIVEAYAGTPDVESICATAPEIAELATYAIESMMVARRLGGRGDAGEYVCKRIPDTGTCATDEELVVAIRRVKAGRK
jgi:hypothetical protein